MKVLHVIPAVAASYGGPSAAVLAMSRALVEAGATSHIATSDADGNRCIDVERGAFVEFSGATAIFFPNRGGGSFKYSPGLARWLARR